MSVRDSDLQTIAARLRRPCASSGREPAPVSVHHASWPPPRRSDRLNAGVGPSGRCTNRAAGNAHHSSISVLMYRNLTANTARRVISSQSQAAPPATNCRLRHSQIPDTSHTAPKVTIVGLHDTLRSAIFFRPCYMRCLVEFAPIDCKTGPECNQSKTDGNFVVFRQSGYWRCCSHDLPVTGNRPNIP